MLRAVKEIILAGLLIVGIIFTVIVHSNEAVASHQIDLSTFVDANDILMFIDNQGGYGYDATGYFSFVPGAGTYYPFLSVDSIQNGSMTKQPLYAAGIWLGGKVSGQIRVSVSEFGSVYWPGPMNGSTYIPNADTVQAYRVYKIYSDSGESNPNTDYSEWPISMGAPIGGTGKPLLLGKQTLWSIFNDANPARHVLTASSSPPLGIEVRLTAWASDVAGFERVIYFDYRIYNKSGGDIVDFYCSIWQDPDLGAAQDDLEGCDSLSEIFYCYNANNNDLAYGTQPPAIGIKMLAGPIVPSSGDSAFFFGKYVQNYKNLKMNSFVSYPNGDDPQSAIESYNLMQGLWRNGTALANGRKYSSPGDPLGGTGDIDTIQGNPHYLGSFGPINFAAGDSQYVFAKLAIGQGTDRLSSLSNLLQILNASNSFPTDVPDEHTLNLPTKFELSQNYPNPFNPITTIEYALTKRGWVTIEVFNLLGQKVRTLVNEVKSAGEHSVTWDGRNESDEPLTTGIYLYRFKSGDFIDCRKMLLLK